MCRSRAAPGRRRLQAWQQVLEHGYERLVVKGLQSPYLGGPHAQVVQGEAAGVSRTGKWPEALVLTRVALLRQSGARPRETSYHRTPEPEETGAEENQGGRFRRRRNIENAIAK